MCHEIFPFHFLKYALKTKSKGINSTLHVKYYVPHVDDTSLYRISGAVIHIMMKKRKSSRYLTRLSTKKKLAFSTELDILKNMCLSKSEKERVKDTLPSGFASFDKGYSLVMRRVILNIARLLVKEISLNTSSPAYSKLGCRMLKVAKLKWTNNKGLKDMFCTCVYSIPECKSQMNETTASLYKEFSDKLFNTTANEFIKRDKFLTNNTAQLMLRDKLKFYASAKQDSKTPKTVKQKE